MAREQTSERLTDEQVRARVEEMWPDLTAWAQRLGQSWEPSPGSILAVDDSQAKDLWPSHLARTSLAIGTENLVTAATYLLNFGPTTFSMQTLLRTAMVGGAQALWVLSPDDRETRLQHTSQVASDSYWNLKKWIDGIAEPSPTAFDLADLERDRNILAKLAPVKPSPRSGYSQTQMIRAAADYVYSKPPSPQISSECMATWGGLSCTAHALPWELGTRPETSTLLHGAVRRQTTVATWASHQAALAFAFAFLDVGWRLVDKRGAAP